MAEFRLPGTGCEPITLFGNPVLRQRTRPVRVFDAALARLVEQLFETMYATDTGVGLAANQIGRTERVFVFDCRDGLVGHVVNPVIHPIDDDVQDGHEGCLSLPGVSLSTERLARCRVRGQDVDGNELSYDGECLRARCFQHETDHLDGQLYIDRHEPLVRELVETELRHAEWYGTPALDPRSARYLAAQSED
jgi:peptide deformylase